MWKPENYGNETPSLEFGRDLRIIMKKCEIVGIEGFAGGNLLFFDVKESLLIYDFFLTGFFFFLH